MNKLSVSGWDGPRGGWEKLHQQHDLRPQPAAACGIDDYKIHTRTSEIIKVHGHWLLLFFPPILLRSPIIISFPNQKLHREFLQPIADEGVEEAREFHMRCDAILCGRPETLSFHLPYNAHSILNTIEWKSSQFSGGKLVDITQPESRLFQTMMVKW